MVVALAGPLLRVDRPFRKRRNDSLNVFLNDFLRDRASPAPVKSGIANKKQKLISRYIFLVKE